MGPVSAREIPPANKFEECLRKCPRCQIGATNAKNPARVKFIYGDQPPSKPEQPAAPQPEEPAAPQPDQPAK